MMSRSLKSNEKPVQLLRPLRSTPMPGSSGDAPEGNWATFRARPRAHQYFRIIQPIKWSRFRLFPSPTFGVRQYPRGSLRSRQRSLAWNCTVGERFRQQFGVRWEHRALSCDWHPRMDLDVPACPLRRSSVALVVLNVSVQRIDVRAFLSGGFDVVLIDPALFSIVPGSGTRPGRGPAPPMRRSSRGRCRHSSGSTGELRPARRHPLRGGVESGDLQVSTFTFAQSHLQLELRARRLLLRNAVHSSAAPDHVLRCAPGRDRVPGIGPR